MSEQPTHDEHALETIAAACAQLAVGRTKIYELIQAGEIDVVRLGPRATRICCIATCTC